MKFRIIVLISVTYVFSLTCSAQNPFADSLLQIAEESTGIDKARLYNKAATYLFNSNPEASVEYAQKAMEISNKEMDWREEYQSMVNVGIGWSYIGKHDKALESHLHALEKFGSQLDEEDLAIIHNELGIDYSYLYDHDKAIQQFLLSLEIKEDILAKDDKPRYRKYVAAAYTNIGMVFSRIENHEKALEYYEKGQALYSIDGDSSSMAKTYTNMGISYDEQGKYDMALNCYFKSLAISEHSGSDYSRATTYSNLGLVYLFLDEPQTSLEYSLKAVQVFKQTGDLKNLAITSNNAGRAHLKMNKPALALPYLQQGFQIAKDLDSPGSLRDSYNYLAQYYALIGDYKRAYDYKGLQLEIKDTINSIDMASRTTEMQTKYETEKKEQEIELLTKDTEIKDLRIKRQQAFTYSLIGVFVIIILVGYLWFSRTREKQKREKLVLEKINLQTEQKLLRAQINPHFMFNALNSVQSYISANDNLKAMSYLAKFSQLMRNILENSRSSMISLEDEIATLRLYMELEAMRFKDSFDFELVINKQIIPSRTYIPPMLIQPFVENSIKHGFMNLDRKGKLSIDFYRINGLLSCRVEDNGIGRDKAMELNQTSDRNHKSLGMQVIRERLDVLSKARKVKATCEVEDIKNEEDINIGTKVLLEIPFEIE